MGHAETARGMCCLDNWEIMADLYAMHWLYHVCSIQHRVLCLVMWSKFQAGSKLHQYQCPVNLICGRKRHYIIVMIQSALYFLKCAIVVMVKDTIQLNWFLSRLFVPLGNSMVPIPVLGTQEHKTWGCSETFCYHGMSLEWQKKNTPNFVFFISPLFFCCRRRAFEKKETFLFTAILAGLRNYTLLFKTTIFSWVCSTSTVIRVSPDSHIHAFPDNRVVIDG